MDKAPIWLVTPWGWAVVAARWVKRWWKPLALAILVAVLAFLLWPRKEIIVTPEIPGSEEREEARVDVIDKGDRVRDDVQDTTDRNRDSQRKVDAVKDKKSKDVDDAIDNWNKGI